MFYPGKHEHWKHGHYPPCFRKWEGEHWELSTSPSPPRETGLHSEFGIPVVAKLLS